MRGEMCPGEIKNGQLRVMPLLRIVGDAQNINVRRERGEIRVCTCVQNLVIKFDYKYIYIQYIYNIIIINIIIYIYIYRNANANIILKFFACFKNRFSRWRIHGTCEIYARVQSVIHTSVEMSQQCQLMSQYAH